MKKYVVIVAGGVGKRMGGEIPKQFIEVLGLPVVFHTINQFYQYDSSIEIIVSLQESYFDFWDELCERYQMKWSYTKIAAGKERFFTVKNALDFLSEKSGFVAIHDAVRPVVGIETIERCFRSALQNNSGVPVVPLTESLRKVIKNTSAAVKREDYVVVQTPQCFELKVLCEAYNQSYQDYFTDDASVFEANGGVVFTVNGNVENLKITSPMDLVFVELLLKQRKLKKK